MIYETIVLDGAIFTARSDGRTKIRGGRVHLVCWFRMSKTSRKIRVTSAQNEKFWTSVFQITYCIPSTCHILHDLFSRPDPITSSSQTPKGHPLPLPRRELRPRRAKQHQSDAGQSVDCHKPMPQRDCMPCELPMICEISNS